MCGYSKGEINGWSTYARASTLQGKLKTSAHLSALQGKALVWHLLRKYDTIIFPWLGYITGKCWDFFYPGKRKEISAHEQAYMRFFLSYYIKRRITRSLLCKLRKWNRYLLPLLLSNGIYSDESRTRNTLDSLPLVI